MKSVVLNDRDRLMSIVPGDMDVVGAWSKFAYKFVLLDDQTLVIAPLQLHSYVYAAYLSCELDVEAARVCVAKFDNREEVQRHRRAIIGAGAIAPNGKVMDWKSGGFMVETPVELRPLINKEIKRLRAAGTLN